MSTIETEDQASKPHTQAKGGPKSWKAKAAKKAAPAKRPAKKATADRLMKRVKGATLAEIMAATKWEAYRARLRQLAG